MGQLRRAGAAFALMLMTVACNRTEPFAGGTPTVASRDLLQVSQSTVRIQDVSVVTLPSGFRMIHRRTNANDIVGLTLYVRHGNADDADIQAGLTTLLAETMTKGTTNRTSEQIAEESGMLGTHVGVSPGKDLTTISMQCINRDLDEAMALFADVVLNPIFPQEQVDLEREQLLASIRMSEDQPSSLAMKRFMRELFGTHPYGRPSEGTPETLNNVLQADLSNTHRGFFVPSNMLLAVVGNVPAEQVESLIAQHFGTPGMNTEPRIDRDKIITPASRRVPILKESQQAFIVSGVLTCPDGHADEYAVQVASTILGAGMSSRLFRELRDKQGLAYAVGASAGFLEQKGYFMAYIGTAPENTRKAEDGLWEQVQNLRQSPVTEEELQRAKNYLAGRYLRGTERNMSQARHLGYWFLTGRGWDYGTEYLEQIEAVTPRDVMRVANKYFLDPTTVIVGPARIFAGEREFQQEIDARLRESEGSNP